MCRSGGTGRRTRLKIWRGSTPRAGSNPASGTILAVARLAPPTGPCAAKYIILQLPRPSTDSLYITEILCDLQILRDASYLYMSTVADSPPDCQLRNLPGVRPDFVGRCERRPPPPEHTTLGHPLPPGDASFASTGLRERGQRVFSILVMSFIAGGEVVVAAHPKLLTELGQTHLPGCRRRLSVAASVSSLSGEPSPRVWSPGASPGRRFRFICPPETTLRAIHASGGTEGARSPRSLPNATAAPTISGCTHLPPP